MSGAPLVTLEHVGRSFDERPVLEDISLEIRSGEFVSLIGRSGCGKSTLLRIIAGLIEPTHGARTLNGTYAFGFQDARLVPWLRVWDNVTLGMAGDSRKSAHLSQRLGSTARKALARRALEHVQLPDVANQWPQTLSGGQMQRVSLARALVRDPDLLLLDEPFGALDALTRWDMQNLLLDLRRQSRASNSDGFATIMVTHDIDESLRLSDRVLVLRDGRIHDELRLDAASHRPRNHAALERLLRESLRA